MPSRWRADNRIAFLDAAAHGDPSAVGRQRAGKRMHQRRLAGAVVADQPHAFAGFDAEIDPVERADGAEMFFDAVQLHDVGVSIGHQRPALTVGMPYTIIS